MLVFAGMQGRRAGSVSPVMHSVRLEDGDKRYKLFCMKRTQDAMAVFNDPSFQTRKNKTAPTLVYYIKMLIVGSSYCPWCEACTSYRSFGGPLGTGPSLLMSLP